MKQAPSEPTEISAAALGSLAIYGVLPGNRTLLPPLLQMLKTQPTNRAGYLRMPS